MPCVADEAIPWLNAIEPMNEVTTINRNDDNNRLNTVKTNKSDHRIIPESQDSMTINSAIVNGFHPKKEALNRRKVIKTMQPRFKQQQ